MSQMINRGKELIRISPKTATKLEYSTNDGRTWLQRFSGSSCGDFHDLTDNGREILAQTSKGLYYSTNEGRTWLKRN
ncbi:hypothetical protein [uncultured Bacteroides sp.]|uniref:hypothetical protein n=1 Tax=uncultured Bacteroides sp. TaxID=162156 RepID=UPI00260C12C7|nr:hypothetical protein [uncultured Bacteroides sp.]